MVPVLFSLLVGCKSDFHYANSFIRKFERGKETATEKIYVTLPKTVIHTNSSLDNLAGFLLMDESEQDSVIASKTQILDKIDDSIFLEQFNDVFLFTLSRLRVPVVLVEDVSLLPKSDDQHFVVNIVQFEAEEYMEPCVSQFHTRKGMEYRYDYFLRHFATNVWLRFDGGDSAEVFFLGDEVAEQFHGTVTSMKDNKANLMTRFEHINTNDAYLMARRMGYQCATLFIEKILTEYVCRTKGSTNSYFYFDASSGSIDQVVPYEEGAKYTFEKL